LVDLRKRLNVCMNNLGKAAAVRSYFRIDPIPIGGGAEQKLLKYCKPNEVTKLCVYQEKSPTTCLY
jgi:hypothetical protein